ncbi:hypothetical protein ASG72_04160 [Bosea sp. Leaf344]|nr:hypothetical protein ASG72_04160 [Bosea sp. Leaf344]
MIFLALGMPSQFSVWGFEALRRIVELEHGGIETIWFDRFDPVHRLDSQSAIANAYFPSRALSDKCLPEKSLGVFFTTSPVEATAYQMTKHGSTVAEALRTVGCSLALMQPLRGRRNILMIDQAPALNASTVIAAIARHFRISVPGEAAVEIERSIGPPNRFKIDGSQFSEADESIATLVLGNAIGHFHDPSVPLKSIWPHRVFYSGDKPNEEAPLVTEATGASRVLYYGPYFHLAEGRWQAKLTLGFSKDAVGLPMKVAAYGPGLLGEANFRARQEGIFSARFNFSVTEPEHPVELHVRTEEGAIEGRIALGQVELTWTAAKN